MEQRPGSPADCAKSLPTCGGGGVGEGHAGGGVLSNSIQG